MTALPDFPPDFETCLRADIERAEAIGVQLIPLATYTQNGEVKQHGRKDWPTATGSVLPHLRDGSGRLLHAIAFLPGPSGIVDIDLDCDAARELGTKLLPQTATFSRKGKTTHYLYRCKPEAHPANGGPEGQERTRVFKNPWGGDKSTLLEIRRGPGVLTVMPPSIKPDGHPAVWDGGGLDDIADWSPEVERAVEQLALASLIASEPVEGRHDSALRWAGEVAKRVAA